MAKYIYLTLSGKKTIVSKIGFCWPALLFGPFWALHKKAYKLAVMLLLVMAFFSLGSDLLLRNGKHVLLATLLLLVQLVFIFLCGKFGNKLLTYELVRKGYKLTSDI
jgi:Protein of unknown function (DUF2628)